jgi:anti-sigma factor ChrR (cupin superfamily)
MKTIVDPTLPDAALATVLLAVAPAEPAPEVAARIRRRVLARVTAGAHAPAAAKIDVRRDEGWEPFAGVVAGRAEMKVLHDDGLTMTWLVRLNAGAALDGHDHAGTEECLVLEGDFWLDGVCYGPGDYQVAFAGSRHHAARSDHGCVVLVRSPSPRPAAVTLC